MASGASVPPPTATSLHPALTPSSLERNNKSSAPDRPSTSGSGPRLCVNTAKATRGADDPRTPSSAVPALGGTHSSASDSTWPSHPRAAGVASYQGHHRRSAPSHDSIPRQTIIKALASVARNNKPEALSLNNMLASQSNNGAVPPGSAASSQMLADALQDLARRQSTPTTALTALQSPCFYHQRFDDAVDIAKVLEEIKNDESMSHSRLVQTATGVREVSKQLQRRPIKRAVRSVMIVTKARDNQLVHLTRELASWLLPHTPIRLGCRRQRLLAEDPRFEHMLKYWTPDLCWNQPDKFDLVLTLGGDGTVLFTSWLFQRVVPPVLSFSLGSLGFMTTFEFEKYKEHLTRVMGDDGMKINLRMRFTCTVWRHDARGHQMDEGEQFEVLNELVIDRGPSPYVSNLELLDSLLTVGRGSLVHPDIPAILLTPICPHTLSFRPMVLSDTMALRVAVPRNSRATAYCAFDGKGRIELRQGDHVTITASQYPFPTVTRTDTEWFDSVSRTLRWNVRAAAQKPFDAGSVADGVPPNEEGEDSCWDIDTDSAYYPSEEGSVSASPIRRQMSMLGL
ncbi:hypothetical protein ACCO45_003518 [Purpureocillium lilacinum]|uniref:Uncharacterized protein n=1 Tax=Purpureocillium lilacinum TaxID=33203 RepID=A0ACC4E031_PURLI